MIISLSEVMQIAGGVFHEEIPVGIDEVAVGGKSYSILKKEPVEITVNNLGGKKVRIALAGRIVLALFCDRCLRDVAYELVLSSEREIDFSLSEKERAEQLDETGFINGYDLDVDEFVCEEILLGFPMKVLCKEDCKGICKVCGANLNEGECGCDRTEPDPRMSVIRDIFNNFKEV